MILIPLPNYGFDPTEAAIPWQFLRQQNEKIIFATPDGTPAKGDERLLTGKGFGPFKQWLMAEPNAIQAYQQMIQSAEFLKPLSYQEIQSEKFSGLLLPGGHDPGMKGYLGSLVLQHKVAEFFAAEKPIGAICHGTIVAARSIDKATDKSVLYFYNTTALLKTQELLAYRLTGLWLKNYYRTYPTPVQTEVTAALKTPQQFHTGKLTMARDSADNFAPAFLVQDRNYVSARWPGDAHLFAKVFYEVLLGER